MYELKKITAIIPARGGSKGLPNKNLRNMVGKPLIAWSIEQAKLCNLIDTIIVSTENDEIAFVARQYGAEIPFKRPASLADDTVNVMDVLIHALAELSSKLTLTDLVVLLQPTSPLRVADDISNAIHIFSEREAHAVVSVCEVDHSPIWANTLPADLCMKNFIRPEALNRNRQDFEVYYRINGAIYLAEIGFLLDNKNFYDEKTFAYVMPRERSVDVDSLVDFEYAEYLLGKSLIHV